MATTIEKKEEYVLTRAQFERRRANGTLVLGSTYHITDDSTTQDLINGTQTSKKAEQDSNGNVISNTYRRKDDSYSVSELDTKLNNKQNKLTAGDNITIDENNVISASGGGFDLTQLPKFTNKIYVNMANKSTQDGVLSIKIASSSNIYIDWGDGTNTLYEEATTLIEHTYTNTTFAGWIYIYGDFKGIVRNNTSGTGTDFIPYLTKIIYDTNIQTIEDSTFIYCKNLTSINMPSVTSIGPSAFGSCKNLTSIDLPNVTSISNLVFSGCTNLVSIDMPNVTSTGEGAFRSCTGLTSINMPNVTSISNLVFYGCTNLVSIDMPNVTSTGNSAFSGCSHLVSIDFPSVQTIGDYTFRDCSSLTSINMPSVKKIGGSAFLKCSNLRLVNISNVQTISSYAFSGCTNLKLVDLLNVSNIGAYAFQNCSKLISMTVLSLYTTPPTLNSSAIPTTIQTIYILTGGLSDYKTRTNWTTYADKIYLKGGQYSETVTIPASSWANSSATIRVVGSTSDARNIIEFMLVDADGNQIEDTYGLKATQGTMQMTFTCDVIPLEDIKIFVKSSLTNV